MKKLLGLFVVFVVGMVMLSGCSSVGGKANDKLNIVCTTYPIYDWVNNITKDVDGVDVSYLLKDGVDTHNYQPSTEDIVTIGNADLFVYIGGESDEWVDGVVTASNNSNIKMINLMESLGDELLPVPEIEGSTVKEEEHEEGEVEYDEHIWMSLRRTKMSVQNITEALSDLDQNNSEKYSENSDNYIKSIDLLDAKYGDAVKSSTTKTIVDCGRYPFTYLFNDYGLNAYAAFSGCSAEAEVSFDTVTFLTNKVKELGVKYVIVPKDESKEIANTVINGTQVGIVELDTLTLEREGSNYLLTMENNLRVLKKLLGVKDEPNNL